MAAGGKTYKLEQATQEKLQAISDEMGLTWDGTFSALADLYAQQKAIDALPGRKTEINEVQSLLNRLSEAFTHSWQVNADTDERIRMEYAQRMATQEEAIAALKEKAETAEATAKALNEQTAAAEAELKEYRSQNIMLQNDLQKIKADAIASAEANAKALADKEKLNQYITDQLNNMKEKVAAADEMKAKIAKMQEELSKLQGELNTTTEKLHHAQREVKDQKDRQTELKGRYEERMELAQQKAANDLRDAVLKAKEEAAAKLDELREKHTAELARLTAAH